MKIIDYIKQSSPKQLSGFICIKKQEILMPYMEIGINCLTRNISELSLFFETILKLIELEVKGISEISEVLGISTSITKEAVVDMVALDYISVSESTLKITSKGSNALKNKQLVEIKKANLNNVLVNLITGDIVDAETVKTINASKNSICLENKIKIDKRFLNSNIQNINQVFQAQQEANSVFGKLSVTKELYKLVSLHYQNLKYVKNSVTIYKSESSDEMQYIFDYDDNNIYLDTMFEQLQAAVPSLEYFFERSWQYKQQSHGLMLDSDLYNATNEIRARLLKNDNSQEIESLLFEKKRYSLFADEYVGYFLCSDEMSFSNIYICSNRINSILTASLYAEINRISEKHKIFILYDTNEFNAKKSIEHFIGKKAKNICVIPCSNIETSQICFESELIINMDEYTIDTLGNTLSYKFPVVDFDKSKVHTGISNIIKAHKLDDFLTVSKERTPKIRKEQ